MSIATLVSYIKDNRGRGVSDEKIRMALVKEGWEDSEVSTAFTMLDNHSTDMGDMSVVSWDIGSLMSMAWERTKAKLGMYIGFLLAVWGLVFAVIMLFVVIGVILAVAESEMLIGVLVLIGIVLMFPIFGWIQYSVIRLVTAEAPVKFSSLIWPIRWGKALGIIGLGLASGLIMLGGFMFFVIPGLILFVYLGFVTYIYVVEDVGVGEALERSVYYVSGSFWGVVGRILVIFGISILASLIIQTMMNADSPGIVLLGALLNLVYSILFGLFSALYTYLMYRGLQARKPAKDFKPVGWFKWVAILSIIWFFVGTILFFFTIGSLASNDSFTEFMNELEGEMQMEMEKEMPEDINGEEDMNWVMESDFNEDVLGVTSTAVSPLNQMRSRLFSYYLMNGEFPSSLELLGINVGDSDFEYNSNTGSDFELCEMVDGQMVCVNE